MGVCFVGWTIGWKLVVLVRVDFRLCWGVRLTVRVAHHQSLKLLTPHVLIGIVLPRRVLCSTTDNGASQTAPYSLSVCVGKCHELKSHFCQSMFGPRENRTTQTTNEMEFVPEGKHCPKTLFRSLLHMNRSAQTPIFSGKLNRSGIKSGLARRPPL